MFRTTKRDELEPDIVYLQLSEHNLKVYSMAVEKKKHPWEKKKGKKAKMATGRSHTGDSSARKEPRKAGWAPFLAEATTFWRRV